MRQIKDVEDLKYISVSERAALEYSMNCLMWILGNEVNLGHSNWTPRGFEYVFDILREWHPHEVMMKGSQLGLTESLLLKIFHGLRYGRFPKGYMYLFPTRDTMTRIVKTRFNPLIENNGCISQYVTSTDSMNVKKIAKSWLYLTGAKATERVGGETGVKDSANLRSDPVDAMAFDEVDLMDSDMIDLALKRMGDAYDPLDKTTGGKVFYLSTPTIPEFGIHQLYLQTDQRVWMIKCQKCNEYTCIELEFPNCIKFDKKGTGYKACKKCGRPIYTRHGEWVAQYPDRSNIRVGRWVSRLNHRRANLARIMEMYENPPQGNLQKVYNDELGMPYIAAEDKLSLNDVYVCCDPTRAQASSHPGPTAMGFDVGKIFHVVIGTKPAENKFRIIKIAKVKDEKDIYDLVRRFNVDIAVCDKYPETRMARRMQENLQIPLFLCEYKTGKADKITDWDENAQEVKPHRTDICDFSHETITKTGAFEIFRRDNSIKEYARQVCNLAKVLVEEEGTGIKRYFYRTVGSGGDHFRHATNYFLLAAGRVRTESSNRTVREWWSSRKKRTAMTS